MYPSHEQPRVRFEEEARTERLYPASASASGMAAWLVRHSGGLVKDERTANYALVVLALIAVIASILLALGGSGTTIQSPTADLINLPQPREGYIPR